MYCEGPIDGVVVKPLDRFEDARGWLVELYRDDELEADVRPAMAYVSQTVPGAARGPHEHRDQTDYFAFIGPGDFKLYLWDARQDSATAGNRLTLVVGESKRRAVLVPPGVVHAYRNISAHPGVVFNAPNRLYKGPNRSEPVDEIRHEDIADTPFVLD